MERVNPHSHAPEEGYDSNKRGKTTAEIDD
jgi:hypothetical protein